jgi:DNA gyrase subunit B
MPELVARGHLYIAQPPLYKVKRGKKEFYLKNEAAFDDFVIQSATEEMRVIDAAGQSIEGNRLRDLALKTLRYSKVFSKLHKRGDPRVLDAVIRQAGISADILRDEEEIAAELGRMQSYLEQHHPGVLPLKFVLEKDLEYDCVRIICETRVGGAPRRTLIDAALLSAPEFNELRALQQQFQSYGTPPFRIENGSEQGSLPRLEQLIEHVERLGRKGLQIQRYKGLGEMNPEQLWETTMNPETRTFLQVRVDDAVEADGIFTVLMGDAVEPRRDFIAQNALNVRKLDV